MIVLDTNVLSELIRGEPSEAVVTWLDRCDSTELYTTAVTAAEVRAGVAKLPAGRRRTLLHAMVEQVLDDALVGSVLSFDVTSAVAYAEITASRRRAGVPISALDAQIAAICLQHDASLATRNIRDFSGLGLTLIDPWAS